MACTDTDLFWTVDPFNPALRVQINADVCAPEPAADTVPYKILFVIDTSLSNTWNDSRENRKSAFTRAIEDYADHENVSFGVITFNDAAHRPTIVFSRNQDILLTAANALTSASAAGATNYEDALTEAWAFISDDIDALTVPEAARTHYVVYWVSDGNPTFGTKDRDTLEANVIAVQEAVERRAFEFVLHTLYLESTGSVETANEITAARQLLIAMAAAGDGEFTNISVGTSFDFDINPAPMMRHFELGTFIANNRHARFGSTHPEPDSDGDGLIDSHESNLNLDPTSPDTDGDGYTDAIELVTAWLEPDRVDQGCPTGDLDTDGDRLRDCEEDVLGTSIDKFDTDNDLLPDGLEVIMNSSALSNDGLADQDLDGVRDWIEVVAHLEPSTANSANEMDLWGYRYEIRDAMPAADGRPCYKLTVDNVGIFETLETAEHPRGAQWVELLLAFQTKDQGILRYDRAVFPMGLILPDEQNPATGQIHFDDLDFAPMNP